MVSVRHRNRIAPLLDQWIPGPRLSNASSGKNLEWPGGALLQLFQFARLNRIPMAALNVDKKLTEKSARKAGRRYRSRRKA
jgi:hypothetical protein